MTRKVGTARHKQTLSSGRIRTSSKTRNILGPSSRVVSNHKRILQTKAVRMLEQEIRFVDMNIDEMDNIRNLQTLIDITDKPDDDGDWQMVDGVLRGSTVLEISNHGGELKEVLQQLSKECQKIKSRSADGRTRRDRVQVLVDAFEVQIKPMAHAYMQWSATRGEDGLGSLDVYEAGGDITEERLISVLDLFWTRQYTLEVLNTDPAIASSLVRQGLIPCAPLKPHLAVSIRTLEVYRITRLRCPYLGVQAFVKILCDIHRRPYKSSLTHQFTVAFDIYNSILDFVDLKVRTALKRNDPDWRLKNACPCCTVRLQDEPKLAYSMLLSMDGNNSLKRVLRRDQGTTDDGAPGPSSERFDGRWGGADYFLPREAVDEWSKEALQDMLAVETETSPCSDRWQNMTNDMTSSMWGIFDEAGIFLSLCRHSFVLVVADMVRSGELAKYPLAIVKQLLEVFGKDLCVGYDVGCKLTTTIHRTSLHELAKRLGFCCIVGLFHGHGHNRLCQLRCLPTYIPATGLENFENCESYFSRSNALAGTTRYSSVFHRHQSIVGYMKHLDQFETYQNLSQFICDNYYQALDILEDVPMLSQAMDDLGMEGPHQFEQWREEERKYLEELTKEPTDEVWRMEYLEKLLALNTANEALEASRSEFILPDPTAYGQRDGMKPIERARRHKEETMLKALQTVQDLEQRYNIDERWSAGSPQWIEAEKLVKNRKYRRCLDTLEGLIVARMFELTKMNMSQTGYKQRKHIAKALQARSQAIRTALGKYNTAAQALRKPQLRWDQVVEYSFLSEFDLLRDARQDIRTRVWATHAGRLAMDRYYKIQGAKHEITRLNVEIRRLVTHMHDEEMYLEHHVNRLSSEDPLLAHQVNLYRLDRRRFNDLHRRRFLRLSKVKGFTGTLLPGVRIDPGPGWSIVNDDCTMSSIKSAASSTNVQTNIENNIPNALYREGGVGGVDDNDSDNDDDDTDGLATAMAVLSVIDD